MLLNAYIEIQIRKGCVSGGGGVKIAEQFFHYILDNGFRSIKLKERLNIKDTTLTG